MEDLKKKVLIELFKISEGDTSAKISNVDIAEGVGIEKNEAEEILMALIIDEFAEMVSLAGLIGITAKGVIEAQKFGAGPSSTNPLNSDILENSYILSSENLKTLKLLIEDIRNDAGNFGLNTIKHDELTSDINTIEAQIKSTRIKTPIGKECLLALKENISLSAKDSNTFIKLATFIGE